MLGLQILREDARLAGLGKRMQCFTCACVHVRVSVHRGRGVKENIFVSGISAFQGQCSALPLLSALSQLCSKDGNGKQERYLHICMC